MCVYTSEGVLRSCQEEQEMGKVTELTAINTGAAWVVHVDAVASFGDQGHHLATGNISKII